MLKLLSQPIHGHRRVTGLYAQKGARTLKSARAMLGTSEFRLSEHHEHVHAGAEANKHMGCRQGCAAGYRGLCSTVTIPTFSAPASKTLETSTIFPPMEHSLLTAVTLCPSACPKSFSMCWDGPKSKPVAHLSLKHSTCVSSYLRDCSYPNCRHKRECEGPHDLKEQAHRHFSRMDKLHSKDASASVLHAHDRKRVAFSVDLGRMFLIDC